MATDRATTTLPTQSATSTKPLHTRRNCRKFTISATDNGGEGLASHRRFDPPDKSRRSGHYCDSPTVPSAASPARSSSPSGSFRIQVSPGSFSPVMDFTGAGTRSNGYSGHESFPSSFSDFNSALTAGLLNPMSPPPPIMIDKTQSSPTLIDLIANEPEIQTKTQIPTNPVRFSSSNPQISVQDKQALALQRVSDVSAGRSPGNQFNDQPSSDIKLTLSSKDGVSVSLSVHRRMLVANSRFFAAKLSDRWTKQQRSSLPYIVEISDCDDVEVYIEALGLMYCKDLRKRLMKENVSGVLGILKVSVAIGFDAGILTCLEFLEAAPWAEDEEEKVASLLSELRLEGHGAEEVLKRVSVEVTNPTEERTDNEQVLVMLLHVVLDGKDEKARKEMKSLVSKLLHENPSHNDISKESLYSASDRCLNLLRLHFLKASTSDLQEAGLIARQADNLHWILDILIDRQIADEFLKTWASESEMADSHPQVPAVHRHEVSRVTARLFVGIGRGQLIVPKEARCLLLKTWLVPFYDDFGWMKRASNGLDRHLVEDGLSNTILTLPLTLQQNVFLAWFNRFLNSSDDCPNLQRGFEVWWKRAFSG